MFKKERKKNSGRFFNHIVALPFHKGPFSIQNYGCELELTVIHWFVADLVSINKKQDLLLE